MLAMSPPRVLVADDNPLSLRFLAEALATCGTDCVEAGNGAEAARHAQEHAFDLLLLDARMPKLDGAAALAQIRSNPGPSRHAIALASTADPLPATHAALIDAGFAAVLVKPLGIDAVRVALATHLGSAICCGEDLRMLDDEQALRVAGGDAGIVDALRRLFTQELDALPTELAVMGARADHAAVRERLHRLDASAGFCGTPGLVTAAVGLRARLNEPDWPADAITDFLVVVTRVRAMLAT